MWKLLLSILLLVTAPVFGQLEPHTLTISATRSINLQPDQVVVSVSVSSDPATSLDQIVGALSSLGITAANLTGISNNYDPPTLQWNFTLAVPLSNLTTTIVSLTNLQQTISHRSFLSLSFYVTGTSVSQQLQQSQSCSNSDLIADATAQGQKLAAAAGVTLGPILKFSNVPLQSLQPASFARAELFSVLNPFPTGTGAAVNFPNFLVAPLTSPVTCSLVVTFQLLP